MSILKSTVKVRHNLALSFMGVVAPKLKSDLLAGQKLLCDLPRPFTLMIKESFGSKPLVGCEIGFGLGENAANLLSELNIAKLYSVDPFYGETGYNECGRYVSWYLKPSEKHVKRVDALKASGKLVFVKATSDDAFSKKMIPANLDFVYIDGNHERDYCLRDIANAMEFVKKGGFVGGHDFAHGNYGVAQAVFDYSNETGLRPMMVYPDFWFQRVS
jgi:hypothetical protein